MHDHDSEAPGRGHGQGRGGSARRLPQEGREGPHHLQGQIFTSVSDPDPGSGAFLTPGSGILGGILAVKCPAILLQRHIPDVS